MALQPMFQPLSVAMIATPAAIIGGSRRSRASRNAPAASTARCVIDRAAACWENASGNFQITTITRLRNAENVPYWYSPARFAHAQEYGLSRGQCPSPQERATSESTGRMEIW